MKKAFPQGKAFSFSSSGCDFAQMTGHVFVQVYKIQPGGEILPFILTKKQDCITITKGSIEEFEKLFAGKIVRIQNK